MTETLSFNQLAKLVEQNAYTLMSNLEWKAFTDKLWSQEEELKRLRKLNEKYRGQLKK